VSEQHAEREQRVTPLEFFFDLVTSKRDQLVIRQSPLRGQRRNSGKLGRWLFRRGRRGTAVGTRGTIALAGDFNAYDGARAGVRSLVRPNSEGPRRAGLRLRVLPY
jgi:hypothetical protein